MPCPVIIDEAILQHPQQADLLDLAIQLLADFAYQCFLRGFTKFDASAEGAVKILVFRLVIQAGNKNASAVAEDAQCEVANPGFGQFIVPAEYFTPDMYS